jgi:hypothetical protein
MDEARKEVLHSLVLRHGVAFVYCGLVLDPTKVVVHTRSHPEGMPAVTDRGAEISWLTEDD